VILQHIWYRNTFDLDLKSIPFPRFLEIKSNKRTKDWAFDGRGGKVEWQKGGTKLWMDRGDDRKMVWEREEQKKGSEKENRIK